jgi:catechol 2,3-dioxygenase-like lactoylglutathione lyase family enzyme
MKRATGLGGVFFRCKDKASTQAWYKRHLGVDTHDFGAVFSWREHDAPEEVGYTVWGTFADDTDYFGRADQPVMLNYRVADLDALLAALKAEGVTIVKGPASEPNGKFAWIEDNDGHRVELWEPVPSAEDPYLK